MDSTPDTLRFEFYTNSLLNNSGTHKLTIKLDISREDFFPTDPMNYSLLLCFW